MTTANNLIIKPFTDDETSPTTVLIDHTNRGMVKDKANDEYTSGQPFIPCATKKVVPLLTIAKTG